MVLHEIDISRVLLATMCREGRMDCWSEVADAGPWRVTETRDEIETLVAARDHDVDVAIIRMPLDESIDTDIINVLRDVSTGSYMPIIAVVANECEVHRCRLLDCGADDVVHEGIYANEMIARMKAMLRVKRLYDELDSARNELENVLQRERKRLYDLQKDNDQLRRMCTTDPLTHVQNVRSFSDLLSHEFKSAKRYGNSLSLLTLDIDHFKVINDNHGHPSGDYVLKELAVILTQSVRESDVVARTGGEEFCIILPRADRDEANKLAERIRQHVFAREFTVHGDNIHATVSLGVATFPSDAEVTEARMLVYFSDQALLIAKETGRDRTVQYSDLPKATRKRMRASYKDVTNSTQSTP